MRQTTIRCSLCGGLYQFVDCVDGPYVCSSCEQSLNGCPERTTAMDDLEIAEQTLWCVRRAADEQCPCRGTCATPCDLPDHVNPSDELIELWEERVKAFRKAKVR